MASVHEKVQAAAAQNSTLPNTISETEYSVSALQQSNAYIKDLRNEIAAQEKNLSTCNRRVDKEFKDHQKYRDSHMRRLAFKLGGKKEKFAEDASREEKEWLDAVAQQLKSKQSLEHLNVNLSDATNTNIEFKKSVDVHEKAKAELDALYKSIFDGPTPEIPEEDEKERAVAQAEERYNAAQLVLSTESQVRSILADADKSLKRAFAAVQEAESHATMDMWGVGGSFAEMAEHNALSQCQQHVSQVEMLMSQAQRIQPEVKRIGDMQIAQMDFMSNVVFDNVFSDMHMRDRIRESIGQLKKAQFCLQAELGASDRRRDLVPVKELKGTLDEKRMELQNVRKRAFDMPPAYEG